MSLTACGGGGGVDETQQNNNNSSNGGSTETVLEERRLPSAAKSPLNAETAKNASWSPLIPLSLVPSSGSVMPDGKVLLWSANSPMSFGGGGQTYTTVLDPVAGTASDRLVQDTGHAMFCTGTTLLADGRLLVNGGSDSATTSIYNHSTGQWARGANMTIPRGYEANTLLQDGSVLTFGGSWSGGLGGKHGEVWSDAGGWRRIPGLVVDPTVTAGMPWGGDSHYWLVPAGNGKVLHPGPGVGMYWLDTNGEGAITYIGDRTDPRAPNGADGPSVAGNFVMYDTGRGLKTGGIHHQPEAAKSNAYVVEFDKGVAVRKVADMNYARVYHNSVVLPDGRVVVIGGQTYEASFTDNNSVMNAEIWDPTTETFTVLPNPIAVGRNYHSIALLLPDGRVMSGGGGLCGGCAANHADVQFLSPPYLFNTDGSAATRPVIKTAPTTLKYGTVINVQTDSPVTDFSLVRMGATTHTVNNDQRRLSLVARSVGNNVYSVQVPSNPGWLLPGSWMLFAMNDKGVPSVAKVVQISATGVPNIQPMPSRSSDVYTPVSFNATATGLGFSYAASGLPPGVTIDTTTGVISGSPTTGGLFNVTVSASNSTGIMSTTFEWTVTGSSLTEGTGLIGRYFKGQQLGGTPVAMRSENIDFAWSAEPVPGLPVNDFSVEWSGQIQVPVGGTYQFQTESDDGVTLTLNGTKLVNNWTTHATKVDTSEPISMGAGQRLPITVTYYNGTATGTARLKWKRPGSGTFEVIPAGYLFSDLSQATGLRGQYFNNTTLSGKPVLTRVEAPNFDWGLASPGPGVNADGFSVRWQGSIAVTVSGDYTFQTTADDGVRLWGGGISSPVIDRWTSGGGVQTNEVGPVYLEAGAIVPITLEYFDLNQAASVRLSWKTPGAATFVPIPATNLLATLPNAAPTVTLIADRQSPRGKPDSFSVTARDPEGGAVTFAAAGLPPGMSISVDGLISGTPTTTGVYNVSVTATDVMRLESSAQFTWTITEPWPEVALIEAPPIVVGTAARYRPVVTGDSSNIDFVWQFGDGSTDQVQAAAAVDHVYNTPGLYQVNLLLRSKSDPTNKKTISFRQAVVTAATAQAPRVSSNILVEPRTDVPSRLWVLNPDANTVAVFELPSMNLLGEVSTGGSGPRTLGLVPSGQVAIVNGDSASLVVIDQNSGGVQATLPLPAGSSPYGVVFSPSGDYAYVALEATGQVLKIDMGGAVVGSLDVGGNPRHLSVSADGARLLVSRFTTAPQPGESTGLVRGDLNGVKTGGEVIDVRTSDFSLQRRLILQHSDKADTTVTGAGVPNYLGGATISPDGRSAWVPSKQDNIGRGTLRNKQQLDFQNTVRAISSRLDLTSNAEDYAARVDHDNSGLATAAVFHPTGAYLFVALETTRQVEVLDPTGKNVLFRFDVGRAPQGLAISPDGKTLYAENFMDRSVSVVDLSPLVVNGLLQVKPLVTAITVANETLPANVLLGKQLFYDAKDTRLARDGYLSCAVCHADGSHDGRTWDFTGFGEGLRNTIDLRGKAGAQGFQHWSANFDEIQDFEGQIRNFAQGTGLMDYSAFYGGTRSQPLGDKKAGLSTDLDALAAYVQSLRSNPSSPWRAADGSLTATAQAGRAIYTSLNCASCHGTPGMPGSNSPLKDVGTLKSTSGTRLGGSLTGIDVPSLWNLWATGPYLHDGSAPTIDAAVRAHTKNTTLPTADQMPQLVEYLRQIGGEQGGTLAQSAKRASATNAKTRFGG